MSDRRELMAAMRASILDGDDDLSPILAQQGLDLGIAPLNVIEEGFVPGIREAGRLFGEGELFLPELVTAAQAMKAAMAIVNPLLAEAARARPAGVAVLGTVKGDIHDIGKTLVGTLLSANGFEVHDLGVTVPVARFVDKAREVDADVIGASALLTTTMAVQRDLVVAVRGSGLRARVLVGGAPTSQEWADRIGADGHGNSAVVAVARARGLVGD